ncbi:MAG: right-handed parallel beta-helix repeat-containing protein [Planctomycetota bacterium]
MEKIRKNSSKIIFIAVIALICSWAMLGSAGDLNPPAPPGPTMKTLDEVEARIPIQSLSESGTALYVISQSGSYYLTGNITGETDKNGIEITADDVTINLNGYALIGPGKTTGSTGHGIYASSKQRISVSNGSVSNWRESGVYLFACYSCSITQISADNNGSDGLHSGDNSMISNCVAKENGVNGIWARGSGSSVSNCSAYQNGTYGIRSDDGCIIIQCASVYNTSEGIRSGDYSVIKGCSSYNNDGSGIDAGYASTVVNCTSCSNDDYGIEAEQSMITENTCMGNGYGNWDLTNCTSPNNHPAP